MDAFSPIGQLFRARRSLCGLASAWGLILAIGLTLQASYDVRPGESLPTTGQWPADSRLAHPTDRLAVLVFVHPRCPCAAATLAELRNSLAAASTHPAVTLVLPRPQQAPPGFCEEARDRLQAAWPGATVFVDPEGAEARLFGATTSGHILVYSPLGELRFSGGITTSRGHRGENLGLEMFIAALQFSGERPLESQSFPVFGCALLDSAAQEEL
ncbi:MAG: hypothetical protein MUF06_05845 [Pirellulaceae bacterium]|nr:hypothetical protein [Pirellulaceae bacterium]